MLVGRPKGILNTANQITDIDFALQAYAQKIAGCLAAAASSSAPEEQIKQAQRWTCESNAMRVFLAVGNLKNFVAFSTTRLDGSMGPGANQLTDAWYQDFLVSVQLTTTCLPWVYSLQMKFPCILLLALDVHMLELHSASLMLGKPD